VSRLIIWRHGQTAWNADDRIQGHVDVPLDDVGRAQATAAAARIAEEHPDAIVSSDLRRTADTAAALAAATGLTVHYDERLREQNFGAWQGLTNAEVRAAYPDAWERWRSGKAITDAGIEDRAALGRRALAAMTDAAELGGTVVVVTHGGTAKLAMGAMLGWPADVSSRVMGLLNCHWAEIQWHRVRGGWVLRSYNLGVAPALLTRSDAARHAETEASAGGADDDGREADGRRKIDADRHTTTAGTGRGAARSAPLSDTVPAWHPSR
jgi:glucosyl-3-phosphoglycerate phosphatase